MERPSIKFLVIIENDRYYLLLWTENSRWVPLVIAWNSSDCFESFSPLSNVVTEGVITTRSNRMKFRLPWSRSAYHVQSRLLVALHGLLIQMPFISLRSLAMYRKQYFEIFGTKRHRSLVSFFSLTLLPSSFAFLVSFFRFSFAGHLVGSIVVGKVFGKAFRS